MPPDNDLSFLSGGGEMGALIRAHDWAATSLGAPEAWPQPLRTMIRLILNTGHPMYIWWGPELTCFYNDAYRQSIGPERHPGSLGRPGREVWDEIWSIIGPQIDQVVSGGGATWSVNALVPITRHGRREDVYWTYSYSPIDDADAPNRVGGVLVVCTETTATVLAERRRAAEAERQRRLFEQAPGFIIVMRGRDHVVEFVNAAHRAVFNSGDWVGKPIRAAFPSLADQGYFEELDRVYTTGETYQVADAAVRYRRSAAAPEELRHMTFIYAPLTGDDGRINGIFCEGFDVTEGNLSKHAAIQLAAVVESSEDAILTKTLDGIITSWNRGAQKLFGYTADEIIGKSVTLLIPSERHDEEPAIIARIRAGEAIAHYETIRQRKDGTQVNISLSVSPMVDGSGRVVGASKIARNITDQKRAQEQGRLLVREMNHRIKNLFALAGGIVTLSARDATTPAALKQTVVERLHALARAHALTLASEDFSVSGMANAAPATLHALIEAILAPYESPESAAKRLRIEGADLTLLPAAVTSFALLIHEFATNAAKYGALSTDSGTIDIGTALTADMLNLTWTEHGTPAKRPVAAEEGFGSYLVKATVKGLGGEITHEWTEAGVIIRLSAALRYVQAEKSGEPA